MANKKDDTEEITSLATNDAWTGMLIVSFLALSVGTGFLAWDYYQYATPPDLKKLTAPQGGVKKDVVKEKEPDKDKEKDKEKEKDKDSDVKQPDSIYDLFNARWRGRIGIAKPLFGTTATQATCLFAKLGDGKAKEFFGKLKANDAKILSGNKQVATAVGSGQLAFGLTDTDDAMEEIAAGSPAAHYLGEYVTVDGIRFPTERRVYVAGPDGKPMPDLMTVSIDLSNYRFA